MVITVTCPSCSSSFPVDPAKIPEGGVNARCSSCAKVFRVEKPAEAEPVPAHDGPVSAQAPARGESPSEAESPSPAESPPQPASPESTAEPPPLPDRESAGAGDGSAGQASTTKSEPRPAPPADDWVVEHEERPDIEPDPLPPVDDRSPDISGSDEPDAHDFSSRISRGSGITDADEGPEPGAHTLPAPAPSRSGDFDRDRPGSRFEFDDGSEDLDAEPEAEARSDAASVTDGERDAEDSDTESEAASAEGTGGDEDASPATSRSQVKGFTFGKRDPTDKAKRLARVLVSDMIMYNAERHQSALAAGTLVDDFEEEIQKSWKEYVDQVGTDLANGEGKPFWTDALNDILAKGKKVF